jgi:hypothetical protein
VVAALENAAVPHALIGAAAMAAHGVSRATVDLDVLVVAPAADLILLKLYAGGPQDLWDITQLLAAGDHGALAEEIEVRLPDLPSAAAALWESLRPPAPGARLD